MAPGLRCVATIHALPVWTEAGPGWWIFTRQGAWLPAWLGCFRRAAR